MLLSGKSNFLDSIVNEVIKETRIKKATTDESLTRPGFRGKTTSNLMCLVTTIHDTWDYKEPDYPEGAGFINFSIGDKGLHSVIESSEYSNTLNRFLKTKVQVIKESADGALYVTVSDFNKTIEALKKSGFRFNKREQGYGKPVSSPTEALQNILDVIRKIH